MCPDDIGPVGPDDRPQLGINAHGGEQRAIAEERLEDRAVQKWPHVDVALRPVVEPYPQAKVFQRLYGDDVHHGGS